MSKAKKKIRADIRSATIERDKHKCKLCGLVEGADHEMLDEPVELDPHHITDRSMMPNGGYVLSNLISLCQACHMDVEDVARNYIDDVTPERAAQCAPSALYKLIGSSYEQAQADSVAL